MKRILIVTALLLFFALQGYAQDSKVDIFAGYSYVRSDPGSGLPGANSSGWEASLAYNWNKWLGLKADLDGHYCCGGQHLHDFLFGPQINLGGHGKVTPYFEGLVGFGHGTDAGFSENAFAFALGGGVDWNIGKRVGWRVVQADYLGTRFAGYTQNNFRLSTGLVFKLGKK
jgi:opacity protein-like surface antigen